MVQHDTKRLRLGECGLVNSLTIEYRQGAPVEVLLWTPEIETGAFVCVQWPIQERVL